MQQIVFPIPIRTCTTGTLTEAPSAGVLPAGAHHYNAKCSYTPAAGQTCPSGYGAGGTCIVPARCFGGACADYLPAYSVPHSFVIPRITQTQLASMNCGLPPTTWGTHTIAAAPYIGGNTATVTYGCSAGFTATGGDGTSTCKWTGSQNVITDTNVCKGKLEWSKPTLACVPTAATAAATTTAAPAAGGNQII